MEQTKNAGNPLAENVNVEMPNQNKKKDFKSWFKELDAKKKGRYGVIAIFLVLTVLATITNIGFKSFNFTKWIINSLILLGIMVFGLYMGEGGGNDKFREKINGLYQRNLKQYNDFNKEIQDKFNIFPQWYLQEIPKEVEIKKIMFLVSQGFLMDDATIIVKYATIDDYKSLTEEKSTRLVDKATGIEHFVNKVNETQKLALHYILNNEYKITFPDYAYFLDAFGVPSEKTVMLEVGVVLEKRKSANTKINRIVKILVSLGVSLFWSILTVYQLMAADDLEGWVTLTSRITGFFTSYFSGYISSRINVILEARQIKNKYDTLKVFKQDLDGNRFVYLNREEQAKKVWLEEQKRKEEAKKNVIDPEIVEHNKNLKLGINTKSIPYSNVKK